MAGKFELKKFSGINIDDPFFDQLKNDYPADAENIGFEKWFAKKAATNSTALVFSDTIGLGAFVSLKEEYEEIPLVEYTMPKNPRMKISTLRLAERYRGQRLGEGTIGLILWKWQKSKLEDIYVTVFPKQDLLIAQLVRFGFVLFGHRFNGECVYVKSRNTIDYSDPYKSFPFIDPNFHKAGYLIVNDGYHDTLFPYSELSGTSQECIALSVANGVSKIYIGSPTTIPPYQIGEPLLIYRKYTGTTGSKGYKSCVTSYCVVNDVIIAKLNGRYLVTMEEMIKRIGNKSVFDEQKIQTKYIQEQTLVVVEMLYYGFFGAGNNVNWVWLKNNGLWPSGYPTQARLNRSQFEVLLKEGNIDVSNVIIDKT